MPIVESNRLSSILQSMVGNDAMRIARRKATFITQGMSLKCRQIQSIIGCVEQDGAIVDLTYGSLSNHGLKTTLWFVGGEDEVMNRLSTIKIVVKKSVDVSFNTKVKMIYRRVIKHHKMVHSINTNYMAQTNLGYRLPPIKFLGPEDFNDNFNALIRDHRVYMDRTMIREISKIMDRPDFVSDRDNIISEVLKLYEAYKIMEE